jgi:hypothetical protein
MACVCVCFVFFCISRSIVCCLLSLFCIIACLRLVGWLVLSRAFLLDENLYLFNFMVNTANSSVQLARRIVVLLLSYTIENIPTSRDLFAV